jgi:hypothetical protein
MRASWVIPASPSQRVFQPDLRFFGGSEAVRNERDGIDAVGGKFSEHFDGGIIAIKGRKFGGEIDAALKKEFRVRSVGGGIGKRGKAGFKIARVLASYGARAIERAE